MAETLVQYSLCVKKKSTPPEVTFSPDRAKRPLLRKRRAEEYTTSVEKRRRLFKFQPANPLEMKYWDAIVSGFETFPRIKFTEEIIKLIFFMGFKFSYWPMNVSHIHPDTTTVECDNAMVRRLIEKDLLNLDHVRVTGFVCLRQLSCSQASRLRWRLETENQHRCSEIGVSVDQPTIDFSQLNKQYTKIRLFCVGPPIQKVLWNPHIRDATFKIFNKTVVYDFNSFEFHKSNVEWLELNYHYKQRLVRQGRHLSKIAFPPKLQHLSLACFDRVQYVPPTLRSLLVTDCALLQCDLDDLPLTQLHISNTCFNIMKCLTKLTTLTICHQNTLDLRAVPKSVTHLILNNVQRASGSLHEHTQLKELDANKTRFLEISLPKSLRSLKLRSVPLKESDILALDFLESLKVLTLVNVGLPMADFVGDRPDVRYNLL